MDNKATPAGNSMMEKNRAYYESLITKDPVSFSWDNPAGFRDGIYENPQFVEGISYEDKPLAIIAAYNRIEFVATYKKLCKLTGMSRLEMRRLLWHHKIAGLISLVPTRDEDTSLLNGAGWIFND